MISFAISINPGSYSIDIVLLVRAGIIRAISKPGSEVKYLVPTLVPRKSSDNLVSSESTSCTESPEPFVSAEETKSETSGSGRVLAFSLSTLNAPELSIALVVATADEP